jgi:hypothetical protein
MKRANELTFLALCLSLLAFNTLPGCRGRKPAPTPGPEPTPVVVVDIDVKPPEFDASLVVKANELEAQLEGRVLWEAARKCKAREFASDIEARDWLKSKWNKCEKDAADKILGPAEQDALGWENVMERNGNPDGDKQLGVWLETAAKVWAAEAQASDSSLKGESL